ncbi:MAG: hypothetical protein HUU02_14650 [Bacteroidetes bacterium]|nr:hypothetical protein [Bacteroidota bacterium]
MKTVRLFLLAAPLLALMFTGFLCEDEAAPAPKAPTLTATSTELTMMNGDRMVVRISGGTMPYEIDMNSNPEVTAIQLDGGELTINTTLIGTSTIVIQDGSWPTQSVTIHVSSVAVINVPGSGTVSYASSAGPFSVTGPVAVSQKSPPSKNGAGAVQWNGLTAVIAYRVNAVDKIDIVELDFHTPSFYLYPRTLAFATAGNAAIIYYVQGFNPYDASKKPHEYLMMNATATITTANDTLLEGTFSGTFTNMRYYLDTIVVTNGMFRVPVKRVGAPEFDGGMMVQGERSVWKPYALRERRTGITTVR